VLEGHSWSGHERNCCHLNLGDGTFADVSALVGLDLDDDGRALGLVDWDGDGDLDLWLRNRTGPQIRFMENAGAQGDRHFVQFALEGRRCNRDAIGAKVTVKAGGRVLKRCLLAGEGNLAQSSKVLHFGLGDASRIEQVTVDWPGGPPQTHRELAADARYLIVQEAEAPRRLEVRTVRLPDSAIEPPEFDDSIPIVLRAPLDVPPTLRRWLSAGAPMPEPTLINLWSSTCKPCAHELAEISASSERLGRAGVRVWALNIEPEERRVAAEEFIKRIAPQVETFVRVVYPVESDSPVMLAIDAMVEHVRGRPSPWPLPLSLLIDPAGRLQVIYVGPVKCDRIVADARQYCMSDVPPGKRSLLDGTWATYVTRKDSMAVFADMLRQRGLAADADTYDAR
jgi:thiol-disulfide isomerase/thioredoxin